MTKFLIKVHKYWYHSPVRFYRTIEEHNDMTNPQNTQFFGTKKPYPLEINTKHRYPIPMVDNSLNNINTLHLYLNNGTTQILLNEITAGKGIDGGRLIYVDVQCDKPAMGRLELVNPTTQKTEFYSNCVEFLDSTDPQGRKFIRIATKHSYDRHLFNFENENVWFITNLPAYCLGNIKIEAEINNNRIGGNSTLKIKDSYIDETVTYDFLVNGDANILNFIQVHTTNNYFFIDGTQRTCLDKLEVSDFAMSGKIDFTNVKNTQGLNILLDENEIFN